MNNSKPLCDSESWESVLDKINSKYKNSKELVLKPMVTTYVVFTGNPYCYEAVFKDTKWIKYSPYNESHSNIDPSLRVLLNVVKLGNKLSSHYFDIDVETFKQINSLREKYGLEGWIYSITRLDDDNVETSYEIGVHSKLEQKLKNEIECLPKFSLTSIRIE